jgi:putative redox protein
MTDSLNNPSAPAEPHVVVRGSAHGFLQEATVAGHTFRIDEPVAVGGTESAPDPYDYLLAALGACTSMTVGWYARHHKIPLENVTVSLRHSRIHAKDCEECETRIGMLDRIDLDLQLSGPITPEQRATLLEIAAKCPVHRTLKSEIDIRLHDGATATPAV